MHCRWNNNKFVRITRLILLVSFSVVALAQDTRVWKKLSEDGLHDPDIEALSLMQDPESALRELPYDYVGNKVSWGQALAEGYIEPRANIYPGTEVKISNLDIVMGNTGEAGLVLFPHRQHTEWLDCKNCHDGIFIEKVGANPMNMLAILNGEYCGVCHGAVSFPLVECNRCHSIARSTFTGQMGAQNSQSQE